MILYSDKCRLCDNSLIEVIDFGKMPIANGFLKEKDFPNEFLFNLKASYCDKCSLFQLVEMPNPNLLFGEEYAYHSGESNYMQTHFENIANLLINKFKLNKDQFCIEIGNNDGGIVEYLNKKNYYHLGIDPSKNVADIAKSKGINVLNDYFNYETACKVEKKYKKADFILAANALAHIPDIKSVFEGIKSVLSSKGVFITEDPYLIDMFNKNSYDQIYDEHVFIFSLTSMKNICHSFGLEVFDVDHVDSAGGSLRYYISHKNAYKKSNNFYMYNSIEQKLNLLSKDIYLKFKDSCYKSKNELLKILNNLNKQKKKVCAYAATSKSTTIYNFCNINTDLIQYATDTTKIKQNKFTPGTHIPIFDYEYFKNNMPDYSFLSAWNLKEEIFNKEKNNFSLRGEWILHTPNPHIIK